MKIGSHLHWQNAPRLFITIEFCPSQWHRRRTVPPFWPSIRIRTTHWQHSNWRFPPQVRTPRDQETRHDTTTEPETTPTQHYESNQSEKTPSQNWCRPTSYLYGLALRRSSGTTTRVIPTCFHRLVSRSVGWSGNPHLWPQWVVVRIRGCTVRLVSRVLSFSCDGRTVEINIPLESSWSMKLISVDIIVNRG